MRRSAIVTNYVLKFNDSTRIKSVGIVAQMYEMLSMPTEKLFLLGAL